jgi:hypothetical protein
VSAERDMVDAESFAGLMHWFGRLDEALARMRDIYRQPYVSQDAVSAAC